METPTTCIAWPESLPSVFPTPGTLHAPQTISIWFFLKTKVVSKSLVTSLGEGGGRLRERETGGHRETFAQRLWVPAAGPSRSQNSIWSAGGYGVCSLWGRGLIMMMNLMMLATIVTDNRERFPCAGLCCIIYVFLFVPTTIISAPG